MALSDSFQPGTSGAANPPFAMLVLSASVLAGVALWFQIAVEFVPALNDIVSIYKIAALEDSSRWVNGFYGPGYTLIMILAGDSFAPAAVISTLLMIVSFLLVSRLTSLLLNGEHALAIFTTFVFYLFLFSVLNTNYSDAIFVYLLFSGLAIYLYDYFSEVRYRIRGHKRNLFLEMLGLLIAGSTVLFRHHGLLLLLLFVTILLIYGPARLGQFPVRRLVVTYCGILAVFAGLFIISQIVRDLQLGGWQIFNLYKFTYGVDWYRIDLLLESPSWRQFSFFESVSEQPMHFLSQAAGSVYHALIPVLFSAGIPALGFLISKERFHLVVLLTVLIYIILVLPGLDRGLYPLMLIVFLSFVMLLYRTVRTPPGLAGMLLLLLILGGWSVHQLFSTGSQIRESNQYVRNDLEPALRAMDAENASSLFTDDYNLVLFSYNTLEINNFQGWLNLHPEFGQRRPNRVFQNQLFDEHDITHVIYLRNGYISQTYPDLPCTEQRTLNEHHICKLRNQ